MHLSRSSTQGGAALGAADLHLSLLASDVDSVLLTAVPDAVHPVTVVYEPSLSARQRRAERADHLLTRLAANADSAGFSSSIGAPNITETLRRLRPDVLHLHWVAAATADLRMLRQLGVPAVWTLRDTWPFTGGCHYTKGCRRHATSCGSCPQLRVSAPWDLSRRNHRSRERDLRDVRLHAVALSAWLASQAQQSSLLREVPVSVIPPSVDATMFAPRDPRTARDRLGLPLHAAVVGFVALHPLLEERKGIEHLLQAATALRSEVSGRPVMLAVVGAGVEVDAVVARTGKPARAPGALDRDELPWFYSACDVLAVPSLEEAFGKVATEAMACGTPVVVYQDTGLADALCIPDAGWAAPHGDVDALADKLLLGLSASPSESSRQALARATARHFSPQAQATAYSAVYRDLLASTTSSP